MKRTPLRLRRVGPLFGYLLFFSMLFVPVSYQFARGLLLAVVMSIIGVSVALRGRAGLHRVAVFWTLWMVTVGLFFMLVGLTNRTPGAIRVGTVYVLWPLVYLVLVAGVSDDRVIRGLNRVLVVATFAVGLYGFSYILFAIGWFPPWLYLPLDQGQGIGFFEGYVEVSLYSLASLLFLVPYLIAALLCCEKSSASPVVVVQG